ncbi:MAG: tRNA pseudouridine(55) synthase TruB [Alphaproteobacteria bacterium]|nr:tRNA pseudouridine(55) synthase TruB [Alphaproteobacteria bacterium]
MARRRRGRPVHGWLVVDKPAGMSSAHAVARIRRLFDAEKAGHAGTLDPLATGVLPIALGEATKTVAYAMDGRKTYRFTVRFGVATATDDAEGAVVATAAFRPDTAAIRAALPAFTGTILQAPPAYSAIRIEGARAYALARAARPVVPAARPVTIESLALVDRPDPDHATLIVRCGKGTYVRSLARDLGHHLGTVAHVAALRRTAVGPFTEAGAISVDKLEALGHSVPPVAYLAPVTTALDDIPALALTAAQAAQLKHGQAVRVTETGSGSLAEFGRLEDGRVWCAHADGRPIALVRYQGGAFRPVRVLNL